MKKSMKIPNKVKKAFAISTIGGALIMSLDTKTVKTNTLKIQIDKAMKIFFHKAGAKTYYTLSDEVYKLWSVIAERHSNTLEVEEAEVFLYMILNLMSKKDMRDFLGFTFSSNFKIKDEKKSAILMTIMALDKELNNMFDVQSTATRESIGNILTPTVTPKRVKKIRDKTVKVLKVKTVSSSKLKEAERKSRVRDFLRNRVKESN